MRMNGLEPHRIRCRLPSNVPDKIRQRIDRPIDIQQRRIGVEVGGEFDPTMPHGSLGDAGVDTGDGQVGAKGGAATLQVDHKCYSWTHLVHNEANAP